MHRDRPDHDSADQGGPGHKHGYVNSCRGCELARWTRAQSTRTTEEPGQWLVAAAPARAVVQVAAALAQGSNRGDGGWC